MSRAVAGISLLVLLASWWWAGSSFVSQGLEAVEFPFPLDYGEGPILDQAVRLAAFENIYGTDLSTLPYVVANYPPLYPLLQAPFVWAFGPAFWYGRAISLAGAVLVAILISLTLHALTRSKTGAVVGGLIFMVFPYVLYWSSLARVDLMGLALSWAGLFVVARLPGDRRAVLLAALLFVAAAYTRQTYALVAPLAAMIWLLSGGYRRRGIELAALVAGAGLGLLLCLSLLTGGGFFFDTVIANLNEFRAEQTWNSVSEIRSAVPYLLAGGGVFLMFGWWFGVRSWWLVAPYLVGAGFSALLIGKVGSNVNYLLELSAALALSAGALVAWADRLRLLQAALVLVLSVQVAGMQGWWEDSNALTIPSRVIREDDIENLSQVVREAEGPVLADEYMGLLPINGRRIILQPFEMTQLSRDGRWDQDPLLRQIEQKRFGVVLIWQPSYVPGIRDARWTTEMLDRIEENYSPDGIIADTVVYRPN